jgi:acyl carrier protein
LSLFFSVKVTVRTRSTRKIVMTESLSVNEIMAFRKTVRPRGTFGDATLLDRTNSNVSERVSALVRTLLVKRSIERPVGRDDDLGESGLSSLDIVNLMLAVEAEFDLTIPETDMRPANFRSMARIEALVATLTRASEPAGRA